MEETRQRVLTPKNWNPVLMPGIWRQEKGSDLTRLARNKRKFGHGGTGILSRMSGYKKNVEK